MLDEAHRAGNRGEGLAAAEAEVRELELLHDGYVERLEALRDRVLAELDKLNGLSELNRSLTAGDSDT